MTTNEKERRALLNRWSKLIDRAWKAPPDSEAAGWADEWTNAWRKQDYSLPVCTDVELVERCRLLESVLGA